MTTITAGQTATFTIPQGQVAQVKGDGIAVLMAPVSSPISIQGQATLGPYGFARIVSLTAILPIDYTVGVLPSSGTSGATVGLLGIVSRPVISTPATAGASIGATSALFAGTPSPTTAIQWLRDGVAISGATSIPYASISSDAGKSLVLRTTATNTSGTITSDSDAVVVGAAAGGTATVITTFPYTLQSSDLGKTLSLQPTGTSEVSVIYPTGLGTSFNCTLTQPTNIKNPIGVTEASGTVGKNSNGLFISSSATQAKGLGSPMLRGPGANVTVTASAADQFVLGGDVGKWQQIAQHTNYPGQFQSGLRQMVSRTVHKVPGGKAGGFFTAIKFLYTNVYAATENTAPADIQITCSLEYPLDPSTVPVQGTFNGGSPIVTLPGGVKTLVATDPIYPNTPIPVGALIGSRTWQGGSGGLVYNTGRDRQDYWTYGTTAGTDLDRTMQLYSAFPALSYTLAGTGIASPQTLRPIGIIGVTDTGAIIIIGTSRDMPSNGDWPTVGGSGLTGEAERTWGRQGAFINIAAATDSMGGSWLTGNVANSSLRRQMFQYGGHVVNNYGVNDLNAGTAANIASLYTSTYNTSAEFLGRNMYLNTITTSLVGTTDYFTTTTNQSQTSPTNEAKRVAVNDMIRAGTIARQTGYADIADTTETARNSGLLKVNSRGRTVADAAISVGSNVLTSASAAFTSADDNCYITLPMGTTGAYVTATMKYVNATTVNLVSYFQLSNFNAITAVAAGQNVYLCSLEVMQSDGNHEMQRGGNIIEALVVAPTIPVVGPVN